MKIGELASALDVNVQTIRYYERRKLIPDPPRTDSGYRIYDQYTLERVRFIQRAQRCGFTLDQIRQLLALRDGGDPTCDDVGMVYQEAEARLSARIAELTAMRTELAELVAQCDVSVECSSDRCGALDEL